MVKKRSLVGMFHEELKGKIIYSVQLSQYSQHDVVKVGGDIVSIGIMPELKDFIGSEPHDSYHDVYHIVIDDGIDTLCVMAIPESLENTIKVGDVIIKKLVSSYAYAKEDEAVSLIGSSGFLEIAMREKNANIALGIKKGDNIIVNAN